jgi:hypothetical protein
MAPISTRNTCGNDCARSYRTLQDGTFEEHFPRHSVAGYDRVVPTGRGPAGGLSSFKRPNSRPGVSTPGKRPRPAPCKGRQINWPKNDIKRVIAIALRHEHQRTNIVSVLRAKRVRSSEVFLRPFQGASLGAVSPGGETPGLSQGALRRARDQNIQTDNSGKVRK